MDEKELQKLYDAVSSKFDVGDFNAFKAKMASSDDRQRFYNTVKSKGVDLGEYSSYEKRLAGTSPAPNPPVPSPPQPEENVLDKSFRAEELKQKQIQHTDVGTEGGITTIKPDVEANKQGEQLSNELKAQGIDSKELYNDFKDMPKEAFLLPHNSIDYFLKQKAENPIEYKMHLNAAKTQMNLYNSVYDRSMADNQDMPEDEKKHEAVLNATHVANLFEEAHHFTTLPEAEDAIKTQQHLVNTYLDGDQRDIELQRIKDNSTQYFTPTNKDLLAEYSTSPFKDQLDPTQYAGLKTLQLFNPDKYEQAIGILKSEQQPSYEMDGGIDWRTGKVDVGEKETDESVNERKGKEVIGKSLAEIGRGNLVENAQRKLINIKSAYNKAATPEEASTLADQYNKYQNILLSVNDDRKKDDERYPLLAADKFNDQTKELVQSNGMNPLEYGIYHFGKTFEKSMNAVENVGTAAFGSDSQNALLQSKRLGESESDQTISGLPSSLQQVQPNIIPKFSKELKDQAKAIQNDDSLSFQEKQAKLSQIVRDNQDKVDYITNPNAGKHANFWSKATLYGNAGTVGDIAGIAAQMYGLGTLGAGRMVSSSLPMFTTAQDDFYKQAVADGNPNPSAFADTHALIMAAAGLINPDLNIVKRSLGLKTVAGKAIAGIEEETWNRIVNENKSLLQKFQNSAKSVVGEAGKMALTYGAGTSIGGDLVDKYLFNKKLSAGDIVDHAVEASKDITLNSLGLFGLNAITHFRDISPTQRAMIWELGDNPKLGMEKIDDAVKAGEITQAKGEERKQIIKNIGNLIPKVPVENEKGKPLTDRQKVDYLYNLVIKSKADDLKGTIPEGKKDQVEGIKAQADAVNESILSGTKQKLKDVKPDEPYTFTYDSEKDIPKQLSGIEPVTKSEIKLQEGGSKIRVTYSGKQLIDAGLAENKSAKVQEEKTPEPAKESITISDEQASKLLSQELPKEHKEKIVKVKSVDPETGKTESVEMPAKEAYVRLKKQHLILDKVLNCL